MAGIGEQRGAGGRGILALGPFVAMLALLFQIAVPPGFMVSATLGSPAIVICTGHGQLLVQPDSPGWPGKAPKSKSNSVCAFAGHGGAPISPSGPSLTKAQVVSFAASSIVGIDLFPGRGLAAPPPPSQAPPALVI